MVRGSPNAMRKGALCGFCLLGVAQRTKTSWLKCSLTSWAVPPRPLREQPCGAVLEKALDAWPEAWSYLGSATSLPP